MPTNNNVGHNERLYRKLRAMYRDTCAATNTPCMHCTEPIDYTAPPRTRRSFTVEHLIPRSMGGPPDDPSNWGPAHLGCNSRRGNRLINPTTDTPTTDPHSEAWP